MTVELEDASEADPAFETVAEPPANAPQRNPVEWWTYHGSGDALIDKLARDQKVARITIQDAKDLLDAVRKGADGWLKGVAATPGLIFAMLALKGPDEGVGKYRNTDSCGLIFGLTIAGR